MNNIDVPNSNIRAVSIDPQIEERMGLEAIAPDGEPTIPSIIITVVQLD